MLTVLIVEDDPSIAELLQDVLECDGYGVVGVAGTIEDAVLLTRKHYPDLAIVDVRLEDGDSGTDLRARLEESVCPKIMFSTGDSGDEDFLSPYGDAVMTKPYRLDDVGQGLRIIDEITKHGRTDIPVSGELPLADACDRLNPSGETPVHCDAAFSRHDRECSSNVMVWLVRTICSSTCAATDGPDEL